MLGGWDGRVRALVDLADAAAEETSQGLASALYNQAALNASDLDLPDLRSICATDAAVAFASREALHAPRRSVAGWRSRRGGPRRHRQRCRRGHWLRHGGGRVLVHEEQEDGHDAEADQYGRT
ncbi:hypothetical protein DMH25_30630 [Streptomyces sp. WAC 01325]|nr:hypothetical protein DMH25_30630 [Streptomyces sp. WAC 01325]